MADWDFILAPARIKVRLIINEAGILTHSLKLLNIVQAHSGLGEWVTQTLEEMTKSERQMNEIFADVADSVPELMQALAKSQEMTFSEYAHTLSTCDPLDLREGLIHGLSKAEGFPGTDALLASKADFIQITRDLFKDKIEEHGYEYNEAVWGLRYEYYQHPQNLVEDLALYLGEMWEKYLKKEWQRTKRTLEECVRAFSALDYSEMNAFDTIETITGRNMRGNEKFEEITTQYDTLIFMPSPHIGPYIGWAPCKEPAAVIIVFGARLPKNTAVQSQELSRSELLVRLNAIADETRLQMLELLTQEDELCAQDFINSLGLSQSSASRHLRQLTASGYISERRRDVAKCYSLNQDRIEDTIRALQEFLQK